MSLFSASYWLKLSDKSVVSKSSLYYYILHSYGVSNSTFRKMKLRSFIEGKRSEDKFIEKIGEIFCQNAIIMYGDWSENEQMKNFIPTKGVGLRRLIHRKFHTISIKEAYSLIEIVNVSKFCETILQITTFTELKWVIKFIEY